MSSKEYPTVDYIRQCLEYRDGKLFWCYRPREHFVSKHAQTRHHTIYAGKEAGYCRKSYAQKKFIDYRWFVKLGKFSIMRSHVVWALHRNKWPLLLDHENRDSLDDRIENLRLATRSQNRANSRMNYSNEAGFKGVSRRGPERWYAEIAVDGKRMHLGTFEDPAEAHAAYCVAARKYFGEFACGG